MNKSSLPAGPSSTLFALLRYAQDPYGAILWAARKYGDPFTWPSLFGKMVVTGDPAVLRTLFTAPPEMFAVPGAEILGPVIGKSNLILLHGEQHRAMRKLQAPPFHGSRMRAYGQLIRDITEEQAQSWAPGKAFCMHRSAQEISLQVILQAVLGLSSPSMQRDFKAAVLAMMESLKPSFLFIPALRRELLGLSAWSRFVRARQRVIELFTQELAERRATPRPRQDIMSLLMEARYEDGAPLSDEELFEQMANLLVAGHETTASALAWACYFIHRDDEVKERLMQELRALPALEPEAIAGLPYLDAVCSEALRLNPVAPLIGRKLLQRLPLQGYELPPATSIGVSILLVHRRPEIFPEPERFRPERFLERTYTPFEYLPFGGGTRRCIGAAFATYELKLALATILHEQKLRLLPAGPSRAEIRNTTVGPRGGIQMMRA